MKVEMTAHLVMDALAMASWRRGRPIEHLHYSDKGSPYASEDFETPFVYHGIPCSMNRRGDCWDNAAVEGFIARLKKKHVYTKPRYQTREEARAEPFDHIEEICNSQRHHPTLGQFRLAEFKG